MSGFDYFYGMEAEQYSFFRIPKILFQAEQFKTLSCEAKVLYGLLLDRMSLSRKNRWFDRENRTYIIFTVEEIVELMNCGTQKAVKLLKELDTDNGVGLVEKKRMGFGKANIIYVKNFMVQQCEDKETDKQSENKEMSEKQENEATNVQNSENHNSGEVVESQANNGENHNSGVVEPQTKNGENHNSRVVKTTIQEFPKSQSNNTDINNTYSCDTHNPSINPSIYHNQSNTGLDGIEREELKARIHKNIDYTALCSSLNRGLDRDLIDELVEIMVETMMTRKKEIRISGESYDSGFVKSRLLKIDMSHIQYVLDSLGNNHTQIRNIKAYLLTALFNAPVTINNYYQAKVNHGMAEFADTEEENIPSHPEEKPEQEEELSLLERALITKNWKTGS
ncbi:MAG: replication initiator protein A [Lachnospiraceae bacterium]|nr:replication initiator protein A [Lachnospiraceae bacterium]